MEDEALIALDESRQLESEGYAVFTAPSGQEAIETVRAHPGEIDLILMDIDLGSGMSGTDAAREILRSHDIPVVFLSSHTEKEIVEKTETITSYGYVVKNTGMTVLTASLKMAFRLHRAHRELKEKEEALQEINSLYDDIVASQPSGIYRIRVKSRGDWISGSEDIYSYEYISDRYCQIIDATREELTADTSLTLRLIHPEDYEGFIRENETARLTRNPFLWEGRMIIRNRVRWMHFESIPRYLENGDTLWTGLLLDITERKEAEEALKKSEERYHSFIELSHEAIYRTEFDEPIDISLPLEEQIDRMYETAYMGECNRAMARLYGIPTPEEFAGKRLVDFHGGKDNPVNRESFRRFIRAGYRSVDIESVETAPDGRKLYFLSNDIGVIENGKLVRIWGTAVDITERRRAEEERRLREEQLKVIFETSQSGIILVDPGGTIILANQRMAELLGLPLEKVIGSSYPEHIHPDQRHQGDEKMRRLIAGEIDRVYTERHYIRADGTDFWGYLAGRRHDDGQGRLITLVGMITDITERRQNEEQLREFQEMFQLFMEYSPIYIFFKDENIRAIQLSRNYEKMLGMPLEQALGKSMDELFPSDVARKIVQDDLNILEEGKPIEIIEELDGHTYSTIKFPIRRKDRPSWLAGFTIDITNQKQYEKALEESERKYRSLFENDITGDFIMDAESLRILDCNEAYLEIFRIDSKVDLLSGRTVFHPEDLEDRRRIIGLVREKQYLRSYECQRHRQDGREISIIQNLVGIHDEKGNLTAVLGYIYDITERKRVQMELQQKTEEIERFFMVNLDLLCIADTEGYFRRLNPEWERLLGYAPEEMEGKPFLNFVHPEDHEATREATSQLARQETIRGFVNRYRARDGSYRWLEWRSQPEGLLIYAAARDITDRIRMEEELKQSVNEQNTLMQELQHRVKNNLGIISSLLGLEMNKLPDEGSRKVFENARNRISSMAAIYEQLYSSGRVERIHLGNYIGRLADMLVKTYITVPGRIKLVTSLEDITLDLRRAVPLGLILNELITNALKYAFLPGIGSELRIDLSCSGDEISLVIFDDGPGIPEEVLSGRKGGLGMQLIEMLTHQIGGTFSYEAGKGTAARLNLRL